MNTIHTPRRGFSIIELLVVIVIISILTAIGVVAYRGMIKNGENTKATTSANQWVKTFETYGARNGYNVSLPEAVAASCLGESSDYPALDSTFTAGVCSSTGTTSNATLQAELAKTGAPSAASWKNPVQIGQSGEKMRGVMYRNAQVGNDTQSYPYIVYALKGDANCGVKHTHKEYSESADSTLCWVRVKTNVGPSAPPVTEPPASTPTTPTDPTPPPSDPPTTLTPEEQALLQAQAYTPKPGCLNVMTPARHIDTGVLYTFTTSCIPSGWVATGGSGGGSAY